MSEETARKVDSEIRKIVDKGYERARKVLTEKIDDLHKLAKALLTYETLSGEEIENLKKSIQKIVKGPSQINIKEVRKPDLDAQILAEGVAQQLEKRVMFRRAMKRTVQSALRQSAKGVRIEVSGRLNGAEIARTEWYREGRVPLHTLRADINYGTAEALTTYGIIGVKVWVYTGEITEDPYKSDLGAS